MAAPHPPDPPSALPRGTRLAEFELRRVLGVGGFGIVYLAFDHALEREVAIKEYMPSSLVGRTGALQVSLLSQANAESFSLGLRSFVNEARLLARFDHPSLVKVHRYWEANNTAYMAMPYYTGSNLHAVRRRMDQPPGEAWLRGILLPLLGALDRLHREGVYHRDISPDNVILQPDGQPVLLDFGAARRVLSDKSMALTAILKPAYAPIEQYAEAGAVKQGAWTDLYSLGATLHFLLLGRPPAPATTRTVVDEMLPLASQQATLPGCSVAFLQCLDWMLQPRPADRPQSVAALQEALAQLPPPPAAPAEAGPADAWPTTQRLGRPPADAVDPTLVDLSQLQPATRVPPRPADASATVILSRSELPGAADATVVMPRAGATGDAGDAATVIVPRPDEATQNIAAPAPAPRAPTPTPAPSPTPSPTPPAPPIASPPVAVPARGLGANRVEPGLNDGPTPSVDDRRAPSPGPAAPTARWPLVAAAAGAAGLVLWLGLKPPATAPGPAAAVPPTAAAASMASAEAASAAASMVMAAAASMPGGIASATPQVGLGPAMPAAPTAAPAAAPAAAPTAASAVTDRAIAQAPASAAAASAAASLPIRAAQAAARGAPPKAAATTTITTITTAPPPRQAAPAAPVPPAPSPAADGDRGLATSITRLPPAAPEPTGAATPVSATRPTAPSASEGGRAGVATTATAAAPLPAPAALSVAPAGAATPTPAPVGQAAPAVNRPGTTTAARATERESEPVLLQTRALSPGERCEGRVLLALWACIDRVCKSEPGLREHADCVKLRRDQERGATPSR